MTAGVGRMVRFASAFVNDWVTVQGQILAFGRLEIG
jgi:hypothetical protein